jgi:hypothetical protein
MMQQPRKYF